MPTDPTATDDPMNVDLLPRAWNIDPIQRTSTLLPSQVAAQSSRDGAMPLVPQASKLTGLEYRITGIYVRDNGTDYIPLVLRYSDLYVLSFAQSNLDNQPQQVSLEGFTDIDDKQHLGINVAPFCRVLTPGDEFPLSLATYVAVIKSNRGIRDLGTQVQALLKTPEFNTAAGALRVALSVTNPATLAAFTAAKAIADIVAGLLGNCADRVLDVTFNTYTALNGDFDHIGRSDSVWKGRYATIYSRLTVRGQPTA